MEREARCAGKITLDVVFGTPENYRSEEITFQVAPVQQQIPRPFRAGRIHELSSYTPLQVHES